MFYKYTCTSVVVDVFFWGGGEWWVEEGEVAISQLLNPSSLFLKFAFSFEWERGVGASIQFLNNKIIQQNIPLF